MAKVLIVDDAAFMRMTIKEALQNAGHEIVGEADSIKETLRLYEMYKPDIVTMDILMKESGVEAIKKIKEKDSRARVVVVSVLSDQEGEVVEAIRSGALGLVTKPINREALKAEVERVLNKKI